MISSGHWILTRPSPLMGEPWTTHTASLAEAFYIVAPRPHRAKEMVLGEIPTQPLLEPRAIISRCPAPGTEECQDCWMTEVPF